MRWFRSGLGGDFDRLWLADLVSGCGSQVTYLAVPLTAALLLGASPAQMGVLGAVEQLPYLVVSLWAGVWADRLPRRALLIATDLGRALLVASIPAAAALGVLGMAWLYSVGFLSGARAVVAGVAGSALLPSLVPREQLVRANARFAAGGSVVGVVGPGLGGALVQALTAPLALLVEPPRSSSRPASWARSRPAGRRRRPPTGCGAPCATRSRGWARSRRTACSGRWPRSLR